MEMKKYILLILISLSACNKDNMVGDVVSTNIDISLKDAYNNDLLDPANENSLKNWNIKVYHERDGRRIEAVEINRIEMDKGNFILDYPHDFFIYPSHENEYRIRVFLHSNPAPDKYGATYINWGGIAEDTIKYKLIRNESVLSVYEVQYNGFLLPKNEIRFYSQTLNR